MKDNVFGIDYLKGRLNVLPSEKGTPTENKILKAIDDKYAGGLPETMADLERELEQHKKSLTEASRVISGSTNQELARTLLGTLRISLERVQELAKQEKNYLPSESQEYTKEKISELASSFEEQIKTLNEIVDQDKDTKEIDTKKAA